MPSDQRASEASSAQVVTVPVGAERSQRVVLPIQLNAPPRTIVYDPDVALLATFTTR